MKKKAKNESIVTLKCSCCGKPTKHYLTKDGEYKCIICQHVDKTVALKEVVFESDFDNELSKVEKEEAAPEVENLLNEGLDEVDKNTTIPKESLDEAIKSIDESYSELI